MMQLLGVPQCALSKKIPELRESDDKIFDDMKQQQRLAMVETLDMLHAHTHIRGSVRDYAQGLLTAQSQERVALMEDHFVTSPVNFGKVDEDYIAVCIVKHTQLSWQMVSKCRAFDSQFVRKFWQVLMNAALNFQLPPEAKAKPVMSLLVDMRVKELGNKFATLTMNDKCILPTGKANWGLIGVFLFVALPKRGMSFLQVSSTSTLTLRLTSLMKRLEWILILRAITR